VVKGIKLTIYGRVQGVFFRETARQKAKKLALTGWVRNAPAGTVEILAQGKEENLKKMIAWCHKGPFLARVERVEIQPLKELVPQSDFIIIS